MASSSSPTTFADINPHIIQTHILPRLDGAALSAVATASSYLQTLSADQNLWSDICNSTWRSISDPRVGDVISTFPNGHRSFFQDSFPILITGNNRRRPVRTISKSPWPSQLISAIDIRYRNDIVYSRVLFTDITTEFLSSALWIELNDDVPTTQSRSIHLKADELEGIGEETISHLKESVTLSWILIDPTRKRAGNLSSIKPVLARKHWVTNDIHLRYVTVLPGCDPNEMVQCEIEVIFAVGKAGVGLHVREVTLNFQDLLCCCLDGKGFLVITQRAISEENNVKRRKLVGNGPMERMYEEFKEMRRKKMERVKKEGKRRELAIKVNNILTLVCAVLAFILLIKRCIVYMLDLR